MSVPGKGTAYAKAAGAVTAPLLSLSPYLQLSFCSNAKSQRPLPIPPPLASTPMVLLCSWPWVSTAHTWFLTHEELPRATNVWLMLTQCGHRRPSDFSGDCCGLHLQIAKEVSAAPSTWG